MAPQNFVTCRESAAARSASQRSASQHPSPQATSTPPKSTSQGQPAQKATITTSTGHVLPTATNKPHLRVRQLSPYEEPQARKGVSATRGDLSKLRSTSPAAQSPLDGSAAPATQHLASARERLVSRLERKVDSFCAACFSAADCTPCADVSARLAGLKAKGSDVEVELVGLESDEGLEWEEDSASSVGEDDFFDFEVVEAETEVGEEEFVVVEEGEVEVDPVVERECKRRALREAAEREGLELLDKQRLAGDEERKGISVETKDHFARTLIRGYAARCWG